MLDTKRRSQLVTVVSSNALDPRDAVSECVAALNLSEACFVLVLVPLHLKPRDIEEPLRDSLSGVPAFGCTTAGQITSVGYDTQSLLIIAFPKTHFRCASVLYSPLRPMSVSEVANMTEKHLARFPHTAGRRLGLLFCDGLSKQEDLLASALETILEDVPIFGGSAGDGLEFEETFVLHGGKFHSNAAVLLLLETQLDFIGLSFDHFLPTDAQLVVTKAAPEERVVYEINGAPAAQEYARLVGCSVEELSPLVFAENPMLVQHKRNHYVRAISDVVEGYALSFLAAIDDGLIMTLGRGKEMIETLSSGLGVRNAENAEPDFILGFDCVLRKLEFEQKQLLSDVSDVFRNANVIGFNTYGEQHGGVHMNQTFVGVAFFERQERNPF